MLWIIGGVLKYSATFQDTTCDIIHFYQVLRAGNLEFHQGYFPRILRYIWNGCFARFGSSYVFGLFQVNIVGLFLWMGCLQSFFQVIHNQGVRDFALIHLNFSLKSV